MSSSQRETVPQVIFTTGELVMHSLKRLRFVAVFLLLAQTLACNPGEGENHKAGSSAVKSGDEISEDLSAPSLTLEAFPVYLSGGELFVLIPDGDDSWQFPFSGSRQGHEIVGQKLIDKTLEPVVIHSTSWRQDGEKLLITYLAVVREPENTPDGYDAFPVAPSGLVRGKATAAPDSIPTQAVIHHALQHLAWLFQTDPVVRENLAGNWNEILRPFQAKPATNLDQGVLLSSPR